jgi:uncharacterized membrane protein
MSEPLDIGITLKSGWETFTKYPMEMVVGFLIVLVGFMVLILGPPLLIGYSRMCLKAARGEDISLGDISDGFSQFVPSLLLFVVMAIGVSIGMVFCVLPGLILAYLWFFAYWHMADGDDDFMSCMRKSTEYMKANVGAGILFVLVQTIVSQVGSVVAIGILLTAPVGALMAAHGYLRAFKGAPA